METPVPENTGSEPVVYETPQTGEVVNVVSATVAAAEAADAAAAEITTNEVGAGQADMTFANAVGTSLPSGIKLFHRVGVWTAVFNQSLIHGVDAAISNAEKAVKAFESLFGK